jgi:hypothetical protein
VWVFPLRATTASGPDQWVLVLGGAIPYHAAGLFNAIAHAAGLRLQELTHHRERRLRDALRALLTQSAPHPDRLMVDVLRLLIESTGAIAGEVTLYEPDGWRRLAAFGMHHAAVLEPATQPLLAGDQFLYPLPLSHDRRLVIHLRPHHLSSFTVDSAQMLGEASAILHTWLAGNAPVLADGFALGDPHADFVQRLGEELDRAQRFNFGLAVLLINVERKPSVDSDAMRVITEAIRQDLRGSDLLGVLGEGRLGVVLVHTDASGMRSVVPRVRRRLAVTAQAIGVPVTRLGRAVLSQDCRTTTALLSQAALDLQAVEMRDRDVKGTA